MSSKKLFIAIGHGKSVDGSWDAGCTYGKYTEADLMKPITIAEVAYLRGSDIEVYTDAPSNNKNMIADVKWANKLGVDGYQSNHCDYRKAPKGTMPLATSTRGRKIAACLNIEVMKGMGMKTRGISTREDLYELNSTNMPAVIFETGSIKADLGKLKKAERYGKCLAKGWCKYLGVKFTGKRK
jgi:N-acetylmuramoyl-L-alanine amidase